MMTDIKTAPHWAPSPSKGLQRAIYNVMQDMSAVPGDDYYLKVADIHSLLPEQFKNYGSKKRVQRALGNMIQRGFAVSRPIKGSKFAEYQIGPYSNYKVRYTAVTKANDASKKRAQASRVNGKVAKTAVVCSITDSIAKIDAQVDELQTKRALLVEALETVKSLV